MKTIELTATGKTLAECAGELKGEVILLTMHEQPIAALVPLNSVDRESWKLDMDPQFVEIIERARAEIKSGKKHSLDAIKREFGVA
jgi:hypothetical protein